MDHNHLKPHFTKPLYEKVSSEILVRHTILSLLCNEDGKLKPLSLKSCIA